MYFIIALVLIINPNIDPQNFKWLAKDIKFLALQMEILDVRESRYILASPNDFVSDLNLVRNRWNDLKFTPCTQLAKCLPNRFVVSDLILFNRNYRSYITNCLALYPDDVVLKAAMEENELCFQFWDAIRDATCEYYYIHIRRQALGRVLEFVTVDELLSGKLPPHVPIWRFSHIR